MDGRQAGRGELWSMHTFYRASCSWLAGLAGAFAHLFVCTFDVCKTLCMCIVTLLDLESDAHSVEKSWTKY